MSKISEEEQRQNDLKAVVSTPEGKRFIASILADCGIYRSSFTGNSQTFFNEGQRAAGLRLIHRIEELEGNQYLEFINATYKKETQ